MSLRFLDLQFRLKGGELVKMFAASHVLQNQIVGWRLREPGHELASLVVRVDDATLGLVKGLFKAAAVHVPVANWTAKEFADMGVLSIDLPAALDAEALVGWDSSLTDFAQLSLDTKAAIKDKIPQCVPDPYPGALTATDGTVVRNARPVCWFSGRLSVFDRLLNKAYTVTLTKMERAEVAMFLAVTKAHCPEMFPAGTTTVVHGTR
jgi:hypothetical protein